MKRKNVSLQALIKKSDKMIAHFIRKPYPRTLYDPPRYLFEGGGKRLRTAMTLLACGLLRKDMEKALPAAVAVEILHNFSLVHDDIMDHDELRRGRPTIHTKWNESVAILSGDLLAAKAYQSLSLLPDAVLKKALIIFNNGFISLCEGQAMDKEFETSEDVSLKEYLAMIQLKTAALFETAMLLGITVARGKSSHEKAAVQFGRAFGLAFQIQDDWLDIAGNEKTFGKDIGSDLIEQKKTYISILVSKHPEGRQWLDRFGPQFPPDEHRRNLESFKQFLKSSGIEKQVHKTFFNYIQKASQALDTFAVTPAKEELSQLTLRLWQRNQ